MTVNEAEVKKKDKGPVRRLTIRFLALAPRFATHPAIVGHNLYPKYDGPGNDTRSSGLTFAKYFFQISTTKINQREEAVTELFLHTLEFVLGFSASGWTDGICPLHSTYA